MIYQSVSEILDSIDETRARLNERLENLTEEQQNFRAAPDAWSVAEIAEHLSHIERQMTQLLGMMLKKGESEGARRAEAEDALPSPVSIEQFAEQARTQKYKAPDSVQPRGGVSIADSLAALRETRAALRSMRPRIEQLDGTQLRYPHPSFGPLDLYQWLIFIGAHEARHLRQIETLLGATGEAVHAG
jgi:hypothetical protein